MLGKQDIWEKRVDSKESPRIKRKSGGRPALGGQARLQEDKENFTIETRDEKVKKGRTGDALALRGEEGRDKLRKAAGRRKWP